MRRVPRPCAVACWLLAACSPAPDGEGMEAGSELVHVPRGAVTLALAGDAMLGRGIEAQFATDPNYALWRELKAPLAGVDIVAFNLETTITDHDEKWEGKKWNFQLSPALSAQALGAVLRDTDVPAAFAATSNNHALDFHVPGLLDTIDNLDAASVAHAGSGPDAATARSPAIITTADGVRVAFFAAATVCSCGDVEQWNATASAPGAWMIAANDDAAWEQAVAAVSAIAPEVDWIVFSLHWGENYIEAWPVPWMRERGAQLIEAGVDVIYGHSAHHVLPIEAIDDGLVLFGTGDFIDDYSGVDGFRNDLSFVGRVTLSPDAAPALTVIPMRLEHDEEHFGRPLRPDDPDFALVMAAAGGA